MATSLCSQAGKQQSPAITFKRKKSPPEELFASEALALHKRDGNQQPALEVDSARLLVIPVLTKQPRLPRPLPLRIARL
jgi:hypothetical protein